jgi:hypothetical protein
MYAIKVKLSEPTDWIYITEDTGKCQDLVPTLYATKDDATDAAKQWIIPGERNVMVVVYNET